MRFKPTKILGISVVIVLLSSVFPFFSVSASTTRIYLDPSANAFLTNTTSVGYTFNLTAWVENAPEIGAWQVYMEFNDSIINVTRWFEPKTDPQYIFLGKTTSANPTPPNPGYVHLSVGKGRVQVSANLFPTPPAQTPSSGTGKLCILELNITATPPEGSTLSCLLHINKAGFTYILNPEGDEVSDVALEDGSYSYSAPAAPPPPPPTAHMWLETSPSTIIATELKPFNVTVNVKNVSAADFLAAIQFEAHYNTSLLQLTGVYEGSFLKTWAIHGTSWITDEAQLGNRTCGQMILPNSTGGWDLPAWPSGDGEAAILTFMPIVEEKASSNITLLPLFENCFADKDGEYLPFLEPMGSEYFYNVPLKGGRIFVDPPEIIDPTAVPCHSDFSINVTIDDIENMKACEFNLTYGSSVIRFSGIGFLKADEQFPVPSIEADDALGFIWVRLIYTNVTVTDPTALVTIMFHVVSLGSTPLNLTNTNITDPNGNPLQHDVFHGFFAAQIRDVAVTNIALSRTWAYAGWPINVTVAVKNKGGASETFNLSTFYDSTLLGMATVTSLAPDEERDVLFEWNTTGIAGGNYTIKAVAETVPYELNVSDNTLIDGKVWIMTQIHDVAVVDVALSSSWVYHGWVACVNVSVQNLGLFSETFAVKAYYNSSFLIGTVHVDNLAPSETFVAQFSLSTSSLLPCHTYPISGEATTVPYEYDETNNVLVDGGLKVRYYADVNGDGMVDVRDMYVVSAAFGTSPGHPRWNPIADLNLDGKIDLKDLFAVATNYGNGCDT